MMSVLRALAHPDPPPALLTVRNVRVSFGPVRALDGVELTIRAGELVALAGENGAGKTTLVRCIAGDIPPSSGQVALAGRAVPADPGAAARRGIAVVWQDLALCDNLDVAGNVLLGRETPRLMLSESRLHAAAAKLLERLDIPIRDTARPVSTLSGGQRQLVAVARAMSQQPKLLVLDEPTAALGVREARQVERLILKLRAEGTTVLLACHDLDQMFRLADRIVVLRQGRVVGDLDPRSTHPDDVVALLSGQQVDATARRQLTRLHGLADRLVSADPSSSLSLILSTLGAALGAERLAIHVAGEGELLLAASLGFGPGQLAPWARVPLGSAGGPVGRAAAGAERVVEEDLRSPAAWRAHGDLRPVAGVASSWSLPVMGPTGAAGVITVFLPTADRPQRDELDLISLYAGYAASAIERDRLLDQVTARNRVLETIREMLETLAGPVPVTEGLVIALQSLRRGLQAGEVALVTDAGEQGLRWRGYAGPLGTGLEGISPALHAAAQQALAGGPGDGSAQTLPAGPGIRVLAVCFTAPAGPTVLLAGWPQARATREETALIEDAAHSLRLALEREEAWLAHQEAAALRRSRELQRGFLSRLSHELRTPLTAIRGYATSLMAPDVTWDRDSQQRFLERIAAESGRLGRLVDDLLDFSAIESGVMRLQRDWCELPLVVEAAAACLPAEAVTAITLSSAADLPVIWADHDRLEQLFVNLLSNALRHNPPGTRVAIEARCAGSSEVEILVSDDGDGMPEDVFRAPFETSRRRRSPTAGAGLGLSIARGIVEAHGGQIELAPVATGTCFRVCLPIEQTAAPLALPPEGALTATAPEAHA